MRITLLGTGTSTGLPIIGCTCRVCTSSDAHDQRTRCACWIEVNGLSLVIDTGPDFRMQALHAGISHLDAILFTHHHFDHVSGLDDVRPFLFRNRRAIPCYAPPETVVVLRRMYHYIFVDGSYPGVPNLDLREVKAPFAITSRYENDTTTPITPIEVFHGEMPILGYRIGRFAYLTDTSFIPETSIPLLQDLDVLILDGLRHKPHHSHYTIEEATLVAQRLGARETYLIHMSHDILHAETDALLPEGVALGYDGLTIDIAS